MIGRILDIHGGYAMKVYEATSVSTVESEVFGIVSDLFEVLPLETLDRNTRLDEDLELDQLERVEFALALEEHFDLIEDVPDELVDEWKTVGEVVDYVETYKPS